MAGWPSETPVSPLLAQFPGPDEVVVLVLALSVVIWKPPSPHIGRFLVSWVSGAQIRSDRRFGSAQPPTEMPLCRAPRGASPLPAPCHPLRPRRSVSRRS